MSFERVTAGAAMGAEPAPNPGPADATGAAGVPPSVRLQILSTEHWSLLASRSLAWNESFSRAGMFLSTLTGAIVALALVAQASAFGQGFVWFALLILPVVLFIGIGTYIRQGGSNTHDAFCVTGMNRIRAAYVELAPDVERYFVTSWHDDARGVSISTGSGGSDRPGPAELLAGTPTMVAILNAVLTGVIFGIVAIQIGLVTAAAVGLGVIGFLAAMVLQGWYAVRSISQAIGAYRPLFPSPDRN